MDAPSAVDLAPSSIAGAAPGAAGLPAQSNVTFHEVLSALNPLQYVPVVGNIYRAVTGDIPPEPVRMVGSFIVSALTGGPIGVAINAAVTALEKLTGFDPDHVVHEVMADVGIVAHDAPTPALPAWTPDQDATYSLAAPLPTSPAPAPPVVADLVQSRSAAAAYAQTQQMGPGAGNG